LIRGDRYCLKALNENYPSVEVAKGSKNFNIRGVVTQQARNRKQGIKRAKHYV
jgi:SOS-response transcriptional repressor LexA